MPWRGPDEPGEFPTLGYQVGEWIEENCAIPDGPHAGEPYRLTNEMWWFLLQLYRLKPNATPDRPAQAWEHARGGLLVRPQKWGKGPFSASWVCAEAAGPVLFAGWDAAGEPVGRPWPTPWIQITAVSEAQTDNVWRALLPMIEFGALAGDVPDTGETRINLPNRGRIEPVTASARSRLGQRLTAAVQDELHSWLARNGGRLLADNQRRNLAGMGGRWLGTTNAWDPAADSVAQTTAKTPVAVLVDYPTPPAGSVRSKRERRKVMKAVYGDSWWVDLDRIDLEIEALLAEDPAQAERFFLNRSEAGESVAFDVTAWANRATGTRPPTGSLVVAGVDGARFDDAVAIVACHVASGVMWPVQIIERPADADDDYEHDLDLIDGALTELAADYDLWRAYIDPQKIEHIRDRWRGKHGEKKILDWYTNRPKAVGYAVRAFRTAITAKASELTHTNDPALNRHIANARRMTLNVKDEDGRPLTSIQKDRRGSPNKMDGAMAAVLAWEARSDAIAAGKLDAPKRRRAVGF